MSLPLSSAGNMAHHQQGRSGVIRCGHFTLQKKVEAVLSCTPHTQGSVNKKQPYVAILCSIFYTIKILVLDDLCSSSWDTALSE